MVLYRRKTYKSNMQKDVVHKHLPKEHKEHDISLPIKENENESWRLPAWSCQKTCSCKVSQNINPNRLWRALSYPLASRSPGVKYPEKRVDNIRKETLQTLGCINPAFESDTYFRAEGNDVCQSKTEKITSASVNTFKTKGLSRKPMTIHMSMRGGSRVLLNRSKSVPGSPKRNFLNKHNWRNYSDTACHNKLSFNGDAELAGNLRSSNYEVVTKHVTNGNNNRKLSSGIDAPQVINRGSRLKQNGDNNSSPQIYNVHIINPRLETLEIGVAHVSDNDVAIIGNDNEMIEDSNSADVKRVNVDEIVLQVQTENMGTKVVHVPPKTKYLEMSVPFNKSQAQNVQLLAQNRQNAIHKRITQTLGIIILVFLICWLPFCIAWPINTFCDCVDTRFYYFTYWAAYVNSTLNPILYFIINRDFRNALRRITLKCCHGNSTLQ